MGVGGRPPALTSMRRNRRTAAPALRLSDDMMAERGVWGLFLRDSARKSSGRRQTGLRSATRRERGRLARSLLYKRSKSLGQVFTLYIAPVIKFSSAASPGALPVSHAPVRGPWQSNPETA